jgi:glycosyltransferase involved in cell wall biosynthesis
LIYYDEKNIYTVNKTPRVSVIIATLNSSGTLSKVLDAISAQTYPKSRIEVLIVDGGSTDNTLEIAHKFGCRIIHNKKVLPQWAKYLGYCKAKGEYLMFLDSDEEIRNSTSIERKVLALRTFPKAKAVTGSGYINPAGYPIINRYVNEFGDPFSLFYYGYSTDSVFFIPSILKKFQIHSESKGALEFDFATVSNRPIFELAAMGGMIDLAFCRNTFPEIIQEPGLLWHLFNLYVKKGVRVVVLKDDPIIHYSVSSLHKYLGKLRYRVITNIYTPAVEGFGGREKYESTVRQFKKYFFLPYAFTVLIPVADSFRLAWSRKQAGYLIHVFLSFYAASLIVLYYILKLFKYKPTLQSYG